ncbi:MAG: carboxypeptidase regulatory-like domain-containing protein [Planctomycetes bacterium]|nr:carboxypeptidase regulatory-like domain-containing protein [Planctomycetota bacterium]
MRPSPRFLVWLIAFAAIVAGGVYWIASPSTEFFTFGNPLKSASRPMDSGPVEATVKNGAIFPVVPHIPPSAELVAKGGTIRGHVKLVPADSEQPHDLVVWLRPSRFHSGAKGAESRDLAVDGKGAFQTDGLKYASYEARAVAAGWSGIPSDVIVSPDATFVDITIRIFKCPDLSGFIRDQTRQPVEAVRVVFSGRSETGANIYEESATASDGSFIFKSVADGEYTVKAGPIGNPLRPPLVIQVREGIAPTVLIDIPKVATVEVRTTVPGYDFPLDGVLVVISRAKSAEAVPENAISGTDGKVIFKNLPAGQYVVRASREYFMPSQATFYIDSGETERVTLSLMPLLDDLIAQLDQTVPPEPAPETNFPPQGPPVPADQNPPIEPNPPKPPK